MINLLIILLLALFPFLAFSINDKEDFNYTYYPKMDSDSAYELYIIKCNYYRYDNKLKILADTRIKEIKQNINKIDNS